MTLIGLLFGALLWLAGFIIKLAVLSLITVIIYRITWFIVSIIWKEIHKGSHDFVVAKVKGLFNKKVKKLEKR